MEHFMRIEHDDGKLDLLVEVGPSCTHAGEKVFVGHGCDKWRRPDGTVDLSEVDVTYFEVWLFCQTPMALQIWYDGEWQAVEKVELLSRGE